MMDKHKRGVETPPPPENEEREQRECWANRGKLVTESGAIKL